MLRERDLAHDRANLTRDGRPVVRRTISGDDPATWNRVRVKINRAAAREGIDGGWTAYEQADGSLEVFAVVGMTGALVTCLDDELADAYAGLPPGAHIRRPQAWALHKPSPKSAGQPAYRVVGVSAVTDRTPGILRHLGLYRGEVDEAAVPLNAWEVHDFTMPAEGSDAYRLLEQAFAVEWGRVRPTKRRRSEGKAA